MKRTVVTTALAAMLAVAALAAVVGSARATYPGATNGRVAFGINVGGNVDVYSVRPNGQDLRRLTTDPGFDACAAYSADGRRIAYCSGQGGGPVQVWTMKQNGTDKQQVTHLSGPAIFPDFSPDGTTIAFDGRPAGATTRNVYVVGSEGGTPQQLATRRSSPSTRCLRTRCPTGAPTAAGSPTWPTRTAPPGSPPGAISG
ncbi:MAG: hypothetical protein E6G21_06200 [Actinobacteria bacterium]|nr:MAG: hypothetical protein E6G21_06200 [Actinomycetota bacterium]